MMAGHLVHTPAGQLHICLDVSLMSPSDKVVNTFSCPIDNNAIEKKCFFLSFSEDTSNKQRHVALVLFYRINYRANNRYYVIFIAYNLDYILIYYYYCGRKFRSMSQIIGKELTFDTIC